MPDTNPATRWLDRFFASYYAHRPVNATFIGVHEEDHRLPDFSENGAGDVAADMKDLLASAEDVLPGASSAAEAMDVRLAAGFLRIQLWELESWHAHRGNPCVYTGEAVFGVMSIFLSDFAPLPQRVESAVARLREVPRLLGQGVAAIRSAPAAWTERALRECDGARLFLTEGIDALVDGDGADVSLRAAADEALRAFADFRSHLATGVRPAPDEAYACGAEAFALHMTDGHFTTRSADELAAYAQVQMEEAEAHLAAHCRDFGAATPAEALAGLSRLHPPEARYYQRYEEVWHECRRIAEGKRLVTWPDFPIQYRPRPRWARAAAPYLYFLFYRSPAAFRRPPVHEYLVAPVDPSMPEHERQAVLEGTNDSVIKLNHVVHHGGIGHHVQNWHAFRAESRVGRVAAVDCASRIAMFCGGTMAEGWACYATDLMGEAGALTPLEQYAERHGRVRMAARTVVDVGLHAGRMTLDDAAAFYQRAGMGAAAARSESVKNSMFPGAAVMYLLGTDTIHDHRRHMARILGNDFDLRGFHDTFLSYGSVPVSLVADDMQRRVADHG